mmetsp:Transcript_1265/g.3820  ORF Transcript_1265/g.3820 Transcript_1265/m.3820 type:complete len:218 (-) Transcript_1265:7-660(-)
MLHVRPEQQPSAARSMCSTEKIGKWTPCSSNTSASGCMDSETFCCLPPTTRRQPVGAHKASHQSSTAASTASCSSGVRRQRRAAAALSPLPEAAFNGPAVDSRSKAARATRKPSASASDKSCRPPGPLATQSGEAMTVALSRHPGGRTAAREQLDATAPIFRCHWRARARRGPLWLHPSDPQGVPARVGVPAGALAATLGGGRRLACPAVHRPRGLA